MLDIIIRDVRPIGTHNGVDALFYFYYFLFYYLQCQYSFKGVFVIFLEYRSNKVAGTDNEILSETTRACECACSCYCVRV